MAWGQTSEDFISRGRVLPTDTQLLGTASTSAQCDPASLGQGWIEGHLCPLGVGTGEALSAFRILQDPLLSSSSGSIDVFRHGQSSYAPFSRDTAVAEGLGVCSERASAMALTQDMQEQRCL